MLAKAKRQASQRTEPCPLLARGLKQSARFSAKGFVRFKHYLPAKESSGLHLEPRSPERLRKLKALGKSLPAMGRTSPTLRRAWPQEGPVAAICVQNVDVQCVLQFTLIHAAGCVLHRRTSRVIHRLKLYFVWFLFQSHEQRGIAR